MALDVSQVESVDLTEAVCFRVAEYDTPFWPSENSRSGRWNSTGDGATQYWSMDPASAWAELLRAEEIRVADDVVELRHRIWASRLTCSGIADLSTFDRIGRAGLDPHVLVSDEHGDCQSIGRALREHGFRGVLAPSAALPGAANVTVFGPRLRVGWSSSLKLTSSVPACVVAHGHPALDILPAVRHYGMEHAGLIASEGRSLDIGEVAEDIRRIDE